MSKLKIGNMLKARRKSLRVTQLQLAELADMSINTLYKMERGQANPTLDTLDKVANILGLELTLVPQKNQMDKS
jgi:transcriptional regulator with XRE-family HTH domain